MRGIVGVVTGGFLVVAWMVACSSSSGGETGTKTDNGSGGDTAVVDTAVVDNTVVDPGTPKAVTYVGQVKAILDAHCISCHSVAKSSGGVALDEYATASYNAKSALDDMESGDMPPTGGPLAQADIDTFKAWANQGTPKQ